ncbi:MAG: SDR family NAD(P)-dependent oxidoreductase [Micrococcales bacterium]|nr:SDR family NAD(P)-dependent oxidoreductase [Micrococcales bacterium]
MIDFTGKTAVVTGAGSGIGLSTAEMMIQAGARVIAVDVSAERLEEAAGRLGEAFDPVVADLTKAAAVDGVMDHSQGLVDILVNNAGIMDGFVPLAEMEDSLYELVMAVNLHAPMRLCRAVLPGMLERGHGTIVNVASEAALRSSISGCAYTVSKHAVTGLTRHIAVLYGKDGIRCNAVAPGAVQTNVDGEMRSSWAASRLGPIMAATVPRFAQPHELAAAICFLADDDAAANVNGILMPVDGGWSAI